jgi:hypothetical protein
MGPRAYGLTYQYLVLRDEERCVICKKNPSQIYLEIDHIDGNQNNNDLDNLCFMCKRHNCEMRGKSSAEHRKIVQTYRLRNEKERDNNLDSPATRFAKRVIDYHDGSVEMKANRLFEIHFISWLMDKLKAVGEITRKEAIRSGAFITGGNTQTIGRYLDKLVSDEGPLCEKQNTFGEVVIQRKERE